MNSYMNCTDGFLEAKGGCIKYLDDHFAKHREESGEKIRALTEQLNERSTLAARYRQERDQARAALAAREAEFQKLTEQRKTEVEAKKAILQQKMTYYIQRMAHHCEIEGDLAKVFGPVEEQGKEGEAAGSGPENAQAHVPVVGA
jgi:Skp family chaperone for outer membrane proteins